MPKVEMNGFQLHYDITGSGPALICIHPPLLTGDIFAYQRDGLADVCRVITFDVRGHGQSAPSPDRLTYSLIAGDIIGLMNHLGIPQAYLCGYSTGGEVALEAMLNYPERFLGGILISAMSEMSDLYNKSRLWAAIALSKLRATGLLSAAITWGNADNRRTFRQLYKTAAAGDRLHLHQYYEASYGYRVTDRLHRIQSPVLLVYGEKDRSFRKYAEIMRRKIVNRELYYIPGAKHQIPTKSPYELHQLIRSWLKTQQRAVSSSLAEPSELREAPIEPIPAWSDAQPQLPVQEQEQELQR